MKPLFRTGTPSQRSEKSESRRIRLDIFAATSRRRESGTALRHQGAAKAARR
jgi:hypothetical protein